MPEKEQITKGILDLLVAIADKEKRTAIEKREYGDAAVAAFLEGMFKEASKSIKDC